MFQFFVKSLGFSLVYLCSFGVICSCVSYFILKVLFRLMPCPDLHFLSVITLKPHLCLVVCPVLVYPINSILLVYFNSCAPFVICQIVGHVWLSSFLPLSLFSCVSSVSPCVLVFLISGLWTFVLDFGLLHLPLLELFVGWNDFIVLTSVCHSM